MDTVATVSPTRPLRLAIIRQRYTPFGGAERFIDNALSTLRERGGLAVTVITREWRGDIATDEVLICAPFHLGRVWRLWAFARAACKAVQGDHYDLVQSHERLCCCDIFRAGDGVHQEWLRQRDRIVPRWRRWLTRLSPFHQLGLWQERRMFASPRLKVVIANSEGVKRDILRHYPTTQARIEVIYNGVDGARFHPGLNAAYRQEMRARWAIPLDASVVLFVGSGFERKGVATALRALPRRADVHLVVVGKERHQPRYEALAQRLGLAQRVHFMGPQTDVRPFYGMADLFVFPSLYDPFPNAVLEAMASGLPVIVSTSCGSADFLPDQALDAPDTVAWRAAIEAALQPAQAMAMARQSRAIAESLGLARMGDAMTAVYASIFKATAPDLRG